VKLCAATEAQEEEAEEVEQSRRGPVGTVYERADPRSGRKCRPVATSLNR